MKSSYLRLRHAGRKILGLVGGFLVLALAGPASAGDLYKADAGPYEVGVAMDVMLSDEAQNLEVPLRVTYPQGEGPFAAIVFSHGAWGAHYHYAELAAHWASHGYVVVQPAHPDSTARGVEFGDTRVFAPAFSLRRIAEAKLILDRINDLGVPAVAGKVDADMLGYGGHSYGANTTMIMGNLTTFGPNGEARSLGDDRIKALAVISGQGLGGGLTEDSYRSIDLPMLVITGSRDPGRGGQDVTWRVDPYTYAAPGNKFLVFIDEADHSFGGITDPAPGYPKVGRDLPDRPNHRAYVAASTTALFDAFVKGEAAAEAWLNSDALAEAADGEVRYERK